MAESTRTEEVTTTVNYHDFYCDEEDCGNCLIGTTTEYPDGGYEVLGAYEVTVLTPDGTFKYYRKYLCDSCRANFPAKVAEALEEIGFTQVGED